MVKCIKDTFGYWTEGKVYSATSSGGEILVGDDEDLLAAEGWVVELVGYREGGSIYQLSGFDEEVLFKECAA